MVGEEDFVVDDRQPIHYYENESITTNRKNKKSFKRLYKKKKNVAPSNTFADVFGKEEEEEEESDPDWNSEEGEDGNDAGNRGYSYYNYEGDEEEDPELDKTKTAFHVAAIKGIYRYP